MSQNQPKVKQYLRPSGILCFTSSSTISYFNCGRLALFRAKTSSIHNEFARPLFKQIEIFFLVYATSTFPIMPHICPQNFA